jgi:hypothetical protein
MEDFSKSNFVASGLKDSNSPPLQTPAPTLTPLLARDPTETLPAINGPLQGDGLDAQSAIETTNASTNPNQQTTTLQASLASPNMVSAVHHPATSDGVDQQVVSRFSIALLHFLTGWYPSHCRSIF